MLAAAAEFFAAVTRRHSAFLNSDSNVACNSVEYIARAPVKRQVVFDPRPFRFR
ncbi:MAG: hypothetical protein OJF62_002250 [Pseudolabrys sp.]|nr:hypothetical protein [Pseudolabrys sp.]